MSFKEKVQKIVLEMADTDTMKEIKEKFLQSTQAELTERFDEVIMKGLEEWKQGTIKAAVKEVIEENPEVIKKIVKGMEDEKE